MTKARVPRGLRKHIRGEKARIRKTLHDPVEQQAATRELYRRLGIPIPTLSNAR